MPPDRTAGQVRSHVCKFCDRDQIEDVKLSRELAAARTRGQINNFGDEIIKPKNIKQTEQRVSHRLQRFVMSQSRKHLSSENRQQEKKQDSNFEIVGTRGPDFGKVIKTAAEHDCAANHSGDFE